MNRYKYGKFAGIFGLVTNIFLGVIKFLIGILSKSVSIMADGINNIIDATSSILTIAGFSLSSKKPSKEHPYGYARYEYVCGFVIALFMLLMGIIFLKESIIKIVYKEDLIINIATYIVLIISIVLKIIQMIVYNMISNKINSNALKANVIDTRNDIISTSTILVSMIIMNIYNINIDGYLGTIISIFVIYSSIKMIKEVLKPIIGIEPSKEKIDRIKDKLLSYDFVLGIHDLIVHNYGVENDYIIVHVEVDSKLTLIDAHNLIDKIESDFKSKGYNLTIHIDPVIVGDKKIDKLKKLVIKSINSFDKDLKIHDFRIIKTKVLFDCVVPYEKTYNSKDISKYLSSVIDENFEYVIEIDRPYCE